MPQEDKGDARAASNAVAAAAQTAGQGRSDLVGLQLGQMSQQFVLLRQTSKVMANHLVGSQRRLTASVPWWPFSALEISMQ